MEHERKYDAWRACWHSTHYKPHASEGMKKAGGLELKVPFEPILRFLNQKPKLKHL